MRLAPIILFCYNRPQHVLHTLSSLSRNDLAAESELYIFCDGPKENASEDDIKKINNTRAAVKSQKWCKEVTIFEHSSNKGLATSIIEGVTKIVNDYGKIIVLEDDIITSKGFLRYMNESLSLYEKDESVMQISGFMYPINSEALPDTFFYNVNSCWGWGTWKHAWQSFSEDSFDLYKRLVKEKPNWDLYNGFQGDEFRKQLLANIEGRLNTWAIKWHTAMFIAGGKVLHPKISLTRNIGFDGSGVHCGTNPSLTAIPIADSIKVSKVDNNDYEYLLFPRIQEYFTPKPKKRSFIAKVLTKLASKF